MDATKLPPFAYQMDKFDRWLVKRIVAWVADDDERRRRERQAAATREGMRRARAENRRVTAKATIPYGWMLDPEDDSRMVEDPHEQTVIARIVANREAGKSLRAIARELTSERVRSRGGGKWSHQTVGAIVTRSM